MSVALAADGLACMRGHKLLFEGLGFALGPGEAALVAGPNGVGKSSLIRLLAGLLTPTAGTITCEGGIALLQEGHALDGERTLGAALKFWAAIDGDAARAQTAMEMVGIDHLAQVPVRWLSTGQRKRAGLARVVASQAPIWLLDEPANGLDVGAVAMLEALIADHRAKGGIALVATHQPIALPNAIEVQL